jgi:hypothetical protein
MRTSIAVLDHLSDEEILAMADLLRQFAQNRQEQRAAAQKKADEHRQDLERVRVRRQDLDGKLAQIEQLLGV